MSKRNWTGISTGLAAASLVGALVFNGVQAHDSAVAQRQSKSATELTLLTQLQSAMNQSIYSRTPFANQFQELRAGDRAALTPAAYRVVSEEATNMNYFAWLFNHGYLTAHSADELWGPLMVCEFQRAFAPAFDEPAEVVPDLVMFIKRRGQALTRTWKC